MVNKESGLHSIFIAKSHFIPDSGDFAALSGGNGYASKNLRHNLTSLKEADEKRERKNITSAWSRRAGNRGFS
jgi:hypothetical protein